MIIMRRISPKADFLLPQEMSRLEKGSFISHQNFLSCFWMSPPCGKKMGFLSNGLALAYLMSSCEKHKEQSWFSKMETHFSSTPDGAIGSFPNSSQVPTCEGPNKTNDRSSRLQIPLQYGLRIAALPYRW